MGSRQGKSKLLLQEWGPAIGDGLDAPDRAFLWRCDGQLVQDARSRTAPASFPLASPALQPGPAQKAQPAAGAARCCAAGCLLLGGRGHCRRLTRGLVWSLPGRAQWVNASGLTAAASALEVGRRHHLHPWRDPPTPTKPDRAVPEQHNPWISQGNFLREASARHRGKGSLLQHSLRRALLLRLWVLVMMPPATSGTENKHPIPPSRANIKGPALPAINQGPRHERANGAASLDATENRHSVVRRSRKSAICKFRRSPGISRTRA